MTEQVQEYLSRDAGTPGSLLIPTTIAELVPAVEKALIGRKYARVVLGPTDINGTSVDINLETADSQTVFRVAEGAAVPTVTSSYTTVNIKPVKYASRPLITKEMVEDGQFNLIGANIRRSGIELAENETSLIITALDGAGNTVSGGTAVTLANITRAMQYLEDSNFKPGVLFVGPEVLKDLRDIDTYVEVDKSGDRSVLVDTGFRGKLYGMDVVVVSGSLITTTSAYVVDPAEAFAIVEKRPVTVKEYADDITDTMGAVLTQRVAVSLLKSGAVAKITSS